MPARTARVEGLPFFGASYRDVSILVTPARVYLTVGTRTVTLIPAPDDEPARGVWEREMVRTMPDVSAVPEPIADDVRTVPYRVHGISDGVPVNLDNLITEDC